MEFGSETGGTIWEKTRHGSHSFLIGMQETGFVKEKISKEQKQDLMHVAVCTVLQAGGFYAKEGVDEEGWPHFSQVKELPVYNMMEQENFLKDYILLYFQNNGF